MVLSKDGVGGNSGSVSPRIIDNASLLAGISSLLQENPSLYCGWQNGGPPFSVPTGTWLIRFGFGLSDAVISLDGGAPVNYYGLPAGIRILTANLKIKVFRPINGNGDVTGDLFFQQDAAVESVDLNQVLTGTPVIKTFAYDFSLSGFGAFFDVINDGFGIRCVFVSAGTVNQGFFDARIEGTHEILQWTFTLNPPDGSQVTAGNADENGTLIIITSDPNDPNHLLLNQLTISVACGAITIVTQTETLFSFYLPIACSGSGLTDITATGNGVQFSGSVSLGNLDILLTDASGIYTLVKNKNNDTLYSSLRDGTTIDVKIPNPFIKTGYIGG